MLRMVRFTADGGLHLEGHSHQNWHLCIVLDGTFSERVNEADVECSAGVVRLSRPGASHEIEFGRQGGECLIIEAAGPFWSRVLARPTPPDLPHVFGKTKVQASMRTVPRAFTAGSGAVTWLGSVLGAVGGGTSCDAPAWAEDARSLIESQPTGSLSGVAREFGVDREAFAKLFRGVYGYRPNEHRTLCRVNTAIHRLMETDQALADLALDCGFADQSHMTNVFRTILGVTPASCRSQPA